MPRLSLCIPTYNRADILGDRLKRMAEMQNELELEICISDNASPDHTQEVVDQFRKSFARFHYVRQPRPIPPGLNFYPPVRNATFDHLLLLGDDDTIMLDSVLTVLSMFARDKELQAIVGNNELFDFTTAQSHGITKFISNSERYTLAAAHELFSRYYFLEYLVVRREPVQRYFHNDSYGYPIGWQLLHSCLRSGTVALEPLLLIYKGHSPDQLGYRNYTLEMQAPPRCDAQWFAALTIPGANAQVRDELRRTGLMRAVRYSSDSSVSANEHKQWLLAMHHSQKAAMYDYETRFYPKIPIDVLLFNRLAHWIAPMVKARASFRELVLEDCPASHRLIVDLRPLLPSDTAIAFTAAAELGTAEGSRFCISLAFRPALSDEAARYPGMPYCALMDVVTGCCDSPPLMSAQIDCLLNPPPL